MKIDTNPISTGTKRKTKNRNEIASYFQENKRIKKESNLAFESQIEDAFTTSSKCQTRRSEHQPMDLAETSCAPIFLEKVPSRLPFKQRTLQKASNLRNIVLFRNFAEDSQKTYNKLAESSLADKEKEEIYQHASQMAARLKRQCQERIKDLTDYGYMN